MKLAKYSNNTDTSVDSAGAAIVTTGAPPVTDAAISAQLNVAYSDGPCEVSYAGRRWQRGIAQTVTAEEWAGMQARHDCAPHGFEIK